MMTETSRRKVIEELAKINVGIYNGSLAGSNATSLLNLKSLAM